MVVTTPADAPTTDEVGDGLGADALARVATLLPGPDSVLRRRASDPRPGVAAAGYALSLQVGHPTIAAGVRDHSDYGGDPWGRFFRTADYVLLLAYGDAATVTKLADDLRTMHRSIRGTDPQGRRYSALEPSAYAWVHATLGESIVRGHDLLGTTFTPAERDEFWHQWLDLGEILGVRRRELPADWSGVAAYMRQMIDDVLEHNDVVEDVKATARFAVGGSPFRWLPAPAWALTGVPMGRVLHFFGAGMLPSELRDRYGLRWTARHQVAFDAACRVSKASTPLLPRPVREAGPLVLRIRRGEIGPFGVSNRAARVDRGRATR